MLLNARKIDHMRFILLAIEDITERRRSEVAIRASEERLRSAAEVGQLALWDWNVRTGEVHWSGEYSRILGGDGGAAGDEKSPYEGLMAGINPDDRLSVEAALRRAMEADEDYVQEFRTTSPGGSVRWLHGRGRFYRDEDGELTRMLGAMIDTTERRELEEQQKVLVGELQHRTRNLMGVVRSMADKTARSSADLPDFRARFRDQLEVLARVQGLLYRPNDIAGVTFDHLIRTELSAINGSSERVNLNGPSDVRLRSSAVQMLALALHELATNAVKYGALGQPQALLVVNWSVEPSEQSGKPWLHIDWRESGVAMPPEDPSRRGQGRELIEQALPYQLGASTSFTLGPDGVRCSISLPASFGGAA
jgi:PAS domain S-box-containing protein